MKSDCWKFFDIFAHAGCDKLSRFGFYLHACVDCGSSFAVYAAVEVDNRPDVLLDTFNRAPTAFGCPMVHAKTVDGAEGICNEIEYECGSDSFITGPSIANQVMLCTCNSLNTVGIL